MLSNLSFPRYVISINLRKDPVKHLFQRFYINNKIHVYTTHSDAFKLNHINNSSFVHLGYRESGFT